MCLKKQAVLALALSTGLFVGCEWESDSDGFNTSQGGAAINISGIYTAYEDGTDLISGLPQYENITIQQVGNVLQVWSGTNGVLSGTMGSPGVVAPSADGTYDNNAAMVQSQVTINGDGSDRTPHDDIFFVGFIRVIAVENVTSTKSGTKLDLNVPPVEIDTESSQTYNITEANALYVLEGTWYVGSAAYNLKGKAPAIGGTFYYKSGTEEMILEPTQPKEYLDEDSDTRPGTT